MSERAQVLIREAMTLSPTERADVAAEPLAASLNDVDEDPVKTQQAWAFEIERRARRLLAGESKGEPWEDARDRIARLLTKQ